VKYFINEFHIDGKFFHFSPYNTFHSSKGIRFDAATQIANDEFLKILVQQSKKLARTR
jgi:hypothetical protein